MFDFDVRFLRSDTSTPALPPQPLAISYAILASGALRRKEPSVERSLSRTRSTWRGLQAGLQLFAFVLLALPAHSQSLSVVPANGPILIHPGDDNIQVPVSVSSPNAGELISVTLAGLPSGITSSSIVLPAGSSGTLTLKANLHAGIELFPSGEATLGLTPNVVTVSTTLKAVSSTGLASSSLPLIVSLANPSYLPSRSSLPVLRIDTGGASIVDKITEVAGKLTLSSADGTKSFLPGLAGGDSTATFHLHGNSTSLMPKLAYHVKLNTSADLLSAMGLNCGYVTGSGSPVCDKSKSFVLLADYDDKTLLRDWSASALALSIPNGKGYLASPAGSPTPSGSSTIVPWAPHSVFVELYLNGIYEGVYQLIEQIKIDSHRVNVKSMAVTDVSGNSVTGGYLMEFDFRRDADAWFNTANTWPIDIDDPDYVPVVPEQYGYISSYVQSAEAALFSGAYTDTAHGWSSYFDTAAAVNYYIVNDLLENWDSGRLAASAYLYKDRNNPLLYFGPVWDFDVAIGNASGWPAEDATIPWMQTQSSWFARLFSDPAFRAAATKQWNQLNKNGIFDQWLAAIRQQSTTLEAAQASNFTRWPMFGIPFWVNNGARETYDDEVTWMIDFIQLRRDYLDSQFNPRPVTTVTLQSPPTPVRAGIPVTIAANVAGSNLTGQVTFRNGTNILARVSVDSSGLAQALVMLPAGSAALNAIYSGDTSFGMSRSAELDLTVSASLLQATVAALPVPGSLIAGGSQSYSVRVLPNSGLNVPTGIVALIVDGHPVQSTSLGTSGSATLSDTMLVAGSHLISVQYMGDATYAATTSVGMTQIVVPSVQVNTALGLTSDTSTLVLGENAVLTASITPAGATGRITFYDATSVIGSAPLNNGVATFSVSTLSVGSHSLSSKYDGDSAFAPSSSSSLTVVVAPPPTASINLLASSGFESQPNGAVNFPWQTEGPSLHGVDVGLGNARSGLNNGFIWDSSSHWNSIDQVISVTPNTEYVFSGYLRSSLVANIGYFSVLGGQGIVNESAFGNLPSYTKLVVRFNSGSNTTMTVRAGFWGANTVQWLQMDDFSVRPNLIANPGFEAQSGSSLLMPWATTGAAAQGVDVNLGNAHEGRNNGYIWSASNGWSAIVQPVQVTPNTSYVLSGWLRSSPSVNAGYLSINQGATPVAETSFGSLWDYTRLTVTFNSGMNTTMDVQAGFFGQGSPAWIQIDDFSLEQIQ